MLGKIRSEREKMLKGETKCNSCRFFVQLAIIPNPFKTSPLPFLPIPTLPTATGTSTSATVPLAARGRRPGTFAGSCSAATRHRWRWESFETGDSRISSYAELVSLSLQKRLHLFPRPQAARWDHQVRGKCWVLRSFRAAVEAAERAKAIGAAKAETSESSKTTATISVTAAYGVIGLATTMVLSFRAVTRYTSTKVH